MRHWSARARETGLRFSAFTSMEDVVSLGGRATGAPMRASRAPAELHAVGSRFHPRNHCLFDPVTAVRPSDAEGFPRSVHGYPHFPSMAHDVTRRHGVPVALWLPIVVSAYSDFLADCEIAPPAASPSGRVSGTTASRGTTWRTISTASSWRATRTGRAPGAEPTREHRVRGPRAARARSPRRHARAGGGACGRLGRSHPASSVTPSGSSPLRTARPTERSLRRAVDPPSPPARDLARQGAPDAVVLAHPDQELAVDRALVGIADVARVGMREALDRARAARRWRRRRPATASACGARAASAACDPAGASTEARRRRRRRTARGCSSRPAAARTGRSAGTVPSYSNGSSPSQSLTRCVAGERNPTAPRRSARSRISGSWRSNSARDEKSERSWTMLWTPISNPREVSSRSTPGSTSYQAPKLNAERKPSDSSRSASSRARRIPSSPSTSWLRMTAARCGSGQNHRKRSSSAPLRLEPGRGVKLQQALDPVVERPAREGRHALPADERPARPELRRARDEALRPVERRELAAGEPPRAGPDAVQRSRRRSWRTPRPGRTARGGTPRPGGPGAGPRRRARTPRRRRPSPCPRAASRRGASRRAGGSPARRARPARGASSPHRVRGGLGLEQEPLERGSRGDHHHSPSRRVRSASPARRAVRSSGSRAWTSRRPSLGRMQLAALTSPARRASARGGRRAPPRRAPRRATRAGRRGRRLRAARRRTGGRGRSPRSRRWQTYHPTTVPPASTSSAHSRPRGMPVRPQRASRLDPARARRRATSRRGRRTSHGSGGRP